ncbi:hypothetical protein GPECTOR_13g609 [Gonium pectorale]|uniref:Uncharacterized protein n=1 Tax=Gonium pectorale TaxID=33097 RepID=A0A150GN14_GONPE|nr:hypothetical protein GPECTOR_13g609 [Gonium pectorale]|eukprot:KXZ51122.1 hypothetical protein GPECTOR_13g609 [Gonium pectorale]
MCIGDLVASSQSQTAAVPPPLWVLPEPGRRSDGGAAAAVERSHRRSRWPLFLSGLPGGAKLGALRLRISRRRPKHAGAAASSRSGSGDGGGGGGAQQAAGSAPAAATVRCGDLLALPYCSRGRLSAALLLGWGEEAGKAATTAAAAAALAADFGTKLPQPPTTPNSSGGGGGGVVLTAEDVSSLERMARFVLYGFLAQPDQAACMEQVAEALLRLSASGSVNQLVGWTLEAARRLLRRRTGLQLTPVLALTAGDSGEGGAAPAAVAAAATRGSFSAPMPAPALAAPAAGPAAFFVLREGGNGGGGSEGSVHGGAAASAAAAADCAPPPPPSLVPPRLIAGSMGPDHDAWPIAAPQVRASLAPLRNTLLLEVLRPRPPAAATAAAAAAVPAAAAASPSSSPIATSATSSAAAAATAAPPPFLRHVVPDAAALLLSSHSGFALSTELQLLGSLAGRHRVGGTGSGAGSGAGSDGSALALGLPPIDPRGLDQVWPNAGRRTAAAATAAVAAAGSAASVAPPPPLRGPAERMFAAQSAAETAVGTHGGSVHDGGGGGGLAEVASWSAAATAAAVPSGPPAAVPRPPLPRTALYAVSGEVLPEGVLQLVAEELEAVMLLLLPTLRHVLAGRLAGEAPHLCDLLAGRASAAGGVGGLGVGSGGVSEYSESQHAAAQCLPSQNRTAPAIGAAGPGQPTAAAAISAPMAPAGGSDGRAGGPAPRRLHEALGRGGQGIVLRGCWGGLQAAVKCLVQPQLEQQQSTPAPVAAASSAASADTRPSTPQAAASLNSPAGAQPPPVPPAVPAAAPPAPVCDVQSDKRRLLRCAWELAVTPALSHPNIVQRTGGASSRPLLP